VREAARFAGGQIPELSPITDASGRVIRQYAMPHSLSREFRDYLQGAAKGKYKVEAADAFKREAGITTEDLLAEGGFLQQRKFAPKADGTAQEFKFGDRTITIEEGTVDELNRKFKALFPEFEGEVYETDPVTAWRRYIQATRKDIAQQGAGRKAQQAGFEGFIKDPGAPERFDPFGDRKEVTTRVNDKGETVPVMRPAAAAEPAMTREQAAVYKMTPNEKATAERNAALRKDPDIKRTQDFLTEEGKGRRTKIAEGMDELTTDVYDPIQEERNRLRELQASSEVETGNAIDAYKETLARREQIPNELRTVNRKLKGIDSEIRRVQRNVAKNIPAKVEELTNELAARRTALTQQRDELIALLEEDLKSVSEKSLLGQQDVKDWSVRAVRTHTKKLEEAARAANLEYDSEMARLMSTTPGVLQPEQLNHYQRIVESAPREIREAHRTSRGMRSLGQVKQQTEKELETLRVRHAAAQRELASKFESMTDEELSAAMKEGQERAQQIKIYEAEIETLDKSIKNQGKNALAKGEEGLSREQADYDEAVRKLEKHRMLVHDKGGIVEGTQPLQARARLAEQTLAEWQNALKSYRAPVTEAAKEVPTAELNAAQRKAKRFLGTKKVQEYEAKVARLEAIDKELASWNVGPEAVKTLEDREQALLAISGDPQATPAARMEARNNLRAVRKDIEKAKGQSAETVQARKALEAEKARIQKWIDRNAATGEKVAAARDAMNPSADVAIREGESAAEHEARIAEIRRLERDRAVAQELISQAHLASMEPIPPAELKMVKGGWYKTEDGYQVIRQPNGAWKLVAPGEFQPGDTAFSTLASAKEELTRLQASPEALARRAEGTSRVPEFQRQVDNLTKSIDELRSVEKPIIEGYQPKEVTLSDVPARGLPEPIAKPERLVEIERKYHDLMQNQTVEAQRAKIAQDWVPDIQQTKQELADVIVRGSQAETEVTINEARDAMDMVNNLTGSQQALGFDKAALEAEQAGLPGAIAQREQEYIGTLQSQEAARAANQAIIDKTGPLVAPDLAKNKVKTGRNQAKAFGTKLEGVKAGNMAAEDAQPLRAVLAQIEKLIAANPLGKDADMLRLQRLAEGYRDELAKLTREVDLPAREVNQIVKAAKSGKLAKVVDSTLQDGITRMWTGGDILVTSDVYNMFYKIREGTQAKGFGRLMKLYTDFFKTYATLSPGFHVRNALSAIFMNFTEGVSTGTQHRGLSLWREFSNSETPLTWLRGQTPEVQDAFRAVFASGSGGQFFEAGVGELSVGTRRLREGIFQNRTTKFSQRVGQDWVEGPVRLGLALDSTQAGLGIDHALQRITRVHFDYSQVSKLDEHAKRYIPFWTYMSRNMPLQITQMWTKPKMYQAYNSFKRNFSGGDLPLMPEYMEQAGAFNTGLTTPGGLPGADKGMPFLLQPDLPQTRLGEDIARLSQSMSGENAGQLLSDFNPAFTAPAEFITGQDFYTGRQYKQSDISKVGIADLPFLPIAALLGETSTGPGGIYVSDKARNTARALVPPYDRLARMFPAAVGEGPSNRQFESMMRFLGMPIRTLSPEQQRGEAFRRARMIQDQAKMAAATRG